MQHTASLAQVQSCVGEQSHGGTPGQGAGSSPRTGAHVQHLFAQLKFKSLKLTTNAVLQRRFGSPFIFREEDPSRQVSPWAGRSHMDLAALEMLQHSALTPVGKNPVSSRRAGATQARHPALQSLEQLGAVVARARQLWSRHHQLQQGKPEPNHWCVGWASSPAAPASSQSGGMLNIPTIVPCVPLPHTLPVRFMHPAAAAAYFDAVSLQITFEISKPEESQIPIWIILGSTLGGLLLLALLVLALWKVSSP